MKRKTLQDLTIKDNFMFAAVMLDSENCKGVLERALSFSVPGEQMMTKYLKNLLISCSMLNLENHNTVTRMLSNYQQPLTVSRLIERWG